MSHEREPEFLTVAEVAQRLRVDQESVRRWLRTRQLPGVNLGRRAGWRIRPADLDAFLKQRSS
jgi:excisionase family DNA binding protein